ncbi:uncharacterized protein TNCV_3576631 [Trichonephila clavipes]|nr:uncharacterized protein TNCV_3576631 [Trichonephila clavipes]
MATDIETRKQIIQLYKSGKTQRYVSNYLNVALSVVNYWINQTSIETKKKSGRIRKTTEAVDDLTFLMSTANPFMSAAEIKNVLKLSLSKQTIRNRLKEKGLCNYVAVKKEALTAHHKQKRLEFAFKYQHWIPKEWKLVCFSDEKVSSTFGKGLKRVWRPKKKLRFDKKFIETVKKSGRKSIPVWGSTLGLLATDHVILNHGQVTWTTPELAPPLLTTTPHQREDVSALDRFNVHRCPTRRVFSGTGLDPVTKQATVRYLYHSATAATILTHINSYVRSLKDNIYFMQDNSPIHTARITTSWLENNQIKVLYWPAKCPDLNPIENV